MGPTPPTDSRPPPASRAAFHLIAYLDQTKNRLLVYSPDGRPLADLTVKPAKGGPLPNVRLENKKGDLRLERLRVARWDSQGPPQGGAGRRGRTRGPPARRRLDRRRGASSRSTPRRRRSSCARGTGRPASRAPRVAGVSLGAPGRSRSRRGSASPIRTAPGSPARSSASRGAASASRRPGWGTRRACRPTACARSSASARRPASRRAGRRSTSTARTCSASSSRRRSGIRPPASSGRRPGRPRRSPSNWGRRRRSSAASRRRRRAPARPRSSPRPSPQC